jgi:hypothetical protein
VTAPETVGYGRASYVHPNPADRMGLRPSAPLASDRPARFHAADRIACPRCQHPLRRLTSGEGSLAATCDNKLPARPGERFGRPCGCPFFASIDGAGVAVVLELERGELEILTAGSTVPALREALELLGILRARSPEAVPSFACSRCKAATKLTELYAGVCRSCAGLKPLASGSE